MDFRSFKELVRIHNVFMTGFAVLIGQTVVLGKLPAWESAWLPVAAGMLIAAGAFALNDFTDYKTDVKNKRHDRPLVRGSVKPESAFALGALGLLLGLFAGSLVNQACLWVAFASAVVSVLYSFSLKKLPLLGNMGIAFTMAVPFPFGSLSLGAGTPEVVLVLAGICFLAGVGREIIKSVQDFEGDKAMGRHTLPIVIGKKVSLEFAALFFVAAALLSIHPFLYSAPYFFDPYYGVLVGVTALLLLSSAASAVRGKELDRVRKWTLRALAVGLLGFFLGALL